MMLRGAVIACQVFDCIDIIYRYGVRDGVFFVPRPPLTKKNGSGPRALPPAGADRGRSLRRFPSRIKAGEGGNKGAEFVPHICPRMHDRQTGGAVGSLWKNA